MDIDRLVLPDIDIIPCIVINILLGKHFVRMQKKKLQDLKLLLCQLKRPAADLRGKRIRKRCSPSPAKRRICTPTRAMNSWISNGFVI